MEICTDRKWNAKSDLQVTGEKLRHNAIIGTIGKGQSDFGYHPSIQIPKAECKEYQHLLQGEVCVSMEEVRSSEMASLSQQGAWTRWENVVQQKITWADFWCPDMNSIIFLIWTVYDMLPSPAILHI